MKKQRICNISATLRMDKSRAVRRYLLELSPSKAPFIPGSLIDSTPLWITVRKKEEKQFRTVEEMITADADCEQLNVMFRD